MTDGPRERLKAYILIVYQWIRDEVSQASEEIAPRVTGALSGVSAPERAVKPLALAGVLLLAAVFMPAAPLAGDATGPVDNGTEPVVGTTYEPVGESQFHQVVTSRVGSFGSDAPPAPTQVRASAGSQTMSVETAVVDGEPAIVLEDDRTHDGRWVAMETSWFEQHVGEVPSAAYIEHEENGRYAAPIETRGGEAAFYVRSFSENLVTFDGEISIDASSASDGDQFEYDLNSTDGVDDFAINVTGVTNTEWANKTGRSTTGTTDSISINGTSPPSGPSSSNKPTLTVTAPDGSYNPYYDDGDGTNDDFNRIMGDDGGSEKLAFEARMVPSKSWSLEQIQINVENVGGSKSGVDSDLYIVPENPDGNVGEGELIASNIEEQISWSEGTKIITLDQKYDLNKGENYTLEFKTTSIDSSDGFDYLGIQSDGSASETWLYESYGGLQKKYPDITLGGDVSNLDVSDGNGNTTSIGDVGAGESKTVEVSSLSTSSTELSWSGAGHFSWELAAKERSETLDPVVEVNGHGTGYSGTLAEGETASLDANKSWLVEGTNTVAVSTSSPPSGPESLTGFDYGHTAGVARSVEYAGEAFSERYSVSKAWTNDRDNATLTIPWASDRVITVRSLEVEQYDADGNLVSTTTPEYTATDGEIVVEVGNVSSGWTTNVTATGSKIRVDDGNVTVTEPTDSGEDLNSTIRVDDAGSDFGLRVGETATGDELHYTANATWGESNSEATFTATGTQRVSVPNATDGGEVQLKTWPIAVEPAQDQVRITDRVGTPDEPGVVVRGSGTAGVTYTFVDAADSTPYVLYSTTNEIVRDEGLASSPLTLTDDNSDETLVFQVDDGTASSTGDGGGVVSAVGGAAPMVNQSSGFGWLRGDLTPAFTILAGLAGLLGTVWVSRRLDLVDDSEADGVVGTARASVSTLLENEIVVGAAVLAGGYWVLSSGVLPEQTTIILALSSVPVGMFLVLQQFGEFDVRIWGGTTALVGVLGTQQLAPELFTTVADEAGIIIAVGAILLGWRALSAWRADANTPDETTNVTFELEDDDGGN